MSTEAKLFVIKYGINCVTQIQNVTHIVIIIVAKCIFDLSIYSYQLHSITIFNDLRGFFNKNSSNSILFWDYPNSDRWSHHLLVDKKSKQHKINSVLLSKSS